MCPSGRLGRVAARRSDDERFADLVRELGDTTPDSDDPRGPRPRRRPRPTTESSGATVEFHFPAPDEPLLGHRPEVRRSALKALRAGRRRPERDVDLHGLTRSEARRTLAAALRAAHASGERCVRVVHGRGRRSPEGAPVLRAALPTWLTTPPLAALVRAFAPAPARDGGPGACFVWLQD